MVVCLTCSFLQTLCGMIIPPCSQLCPPRPTTTLKLEHWCRVLKVYEVLCMLGSLQGCLRFHCVTRTVNCWSLDRSLSPSTLPWLLYTQP